jgi:arylformamidase
MNSTTDLLKKIVVGLSHPIDISVPLAFNGPQPNAYGVEKAASKPFEAGDLVGDTRLGGSCNFEQYTIIPHCNGTHTECVGHITYERISVRDCLQDVFTTARLLSLEPEQIGEDKVITVRSLGDAIAPDKSFEADQHLSRSLIVRTLPNDDHKLTVVYDDQNIPPYFSADAITMIVAAGYKHLLVDLPSIDRLFDDGKLVNHRTFWNLSPGSCETTPATRINSTITELIYVPNEVPDGEYFLNLQIAPFQTDAAPSRPLLFDLRDSKA